MNELITLQGGIGVLNPGTAEQIAEIEKMVKRAKAAEDELKAAILQEMRDKGIVKVETDSLVITYIAPTDRETFDSKALKKDAPDVYDAYLRMVPVSDSVRIKLR